MNLNNNKIKIIAGVVLLLVLISSALSFVGCGYKENDVNHNPEDLVNGMLAKMKAAGCEEMKATAEFFFQAGYISSVYDYQVEIIDGKLYLHGYIFDDITFVNNHQVAYKDTILEEALKHDKEKYDILLKIQNHKGCYILKPQEDNAIAFKIAVYEIDNSYYFLEYYYDDVEVTKIHKVTINQEDVYEIEQECIFFVFIAIWSIIFMHTIVVNAFVEDTYDFENFTYEDAISFVEEHNIEIPNEMLERSNDIRWRKRSFPDTNYTAQSPRGRN